MTEIDEPREYEVVVVGGGPAGLQTALYTTRLGHDTALVDRGGGRAAMMLDTHNVIGVTEDVSGNEFLETARGQLEDYGTDIHRDFVTDAERLDDGRFRLVGNEGEFVADRVVLGVGFNDERPDPPLPRTGKGLHYCLHCDAYMFVDESVYVMGHSDSAAYVAMIMLNFTDEVDLLLRGDEPTWSDETDELVRAHPVDIVEAEISGMTKRDDGWLESFEFEDGTVREYKGGFAMYGSSYNTTLFEALDVELNDDETVPVDDHGRTSADGVFAVGDITPGHNQIPVAMGKGAKAGIAIHMELREFPKSLDEIRAEGAVSVDDVPGISPGLLDKAKRFNESHADD
ncbi:NAD(P)/FAD-dependent oxidoreductase [Haloferax sp. Atlit-10N]|uniref:Thioredoxin reductase n=1 Tax=Haloferax prahovense (strain DSM 18310 / JCM 13924 / TL6) TaxID=1227461 RepID=M0GLH1_HALPT|nr:MULTISPECIES: NAD(P)/FAD-dependent oxidoreductase [Haloferax]ELZ72387.1 thioredoxin reductase [Haloferax prahovense DSM 18310]RDZ46770.1 NAD(P)/FAD-dependent oxidoreductase [Haloferax sp. Atlit-16N]RDZ60602.1 NAD(P)/FAD-dependent oxidoreductase [Haloferax sp. Atlit-10N]